MPSEVAPYNNVQEGGCKDDVEEVKGCQPSISKKVKLSEAGKKEVHSVADVDPNLAGNEKMNSNDEGGVDYKKR